MAQTETDRICLHALVGPSSGSVGNTFSIVGDVEVDLTNYFSFVGEAGILPRAPFREASEVATPLPSTSTNERG